MDLRERRRAATRSAIEDAALELFARDGFQATTVDRLCAHAGVGRRTFFRYFATKEDVLLQRLRVDIATVRKAFRAAPAGEPVRALLVRSVIAVVSDGSVTSWAATVLGIPTLRPLYLGVLADFEDALAILIAEHLQLRPGDERVRFIAAGAVTGFRVGLLTAATTPGADAATVLRRSVQAFIPDD